MSESSKRKRNARRREARKKLEEDALAAKNKYGFSDLTPYNALTGQKITSASMPLTDINGPDARVAAGFNTAKK